MKIRFTKSAKKDLKDLDKDIKKKVNNEINLLRQGKSRIILLQGNKTEGKVKVDDYRIRFTYDKENKVITIKGIPQRKNAYRDI
jgi:mRNA-degrading endonuclease RelE of RelBE toxin-antitoxin system